jgi:hypothetical protein
MTPTWSQIREWLLLTMDKAGIEQRMGPSLYAMFRAGGLQPCARPDAADGCAIGPPMFGVWATT